MRTQPQPALAAAQEPAEKLLHRVVESELKAQQADHSHWMYQDVSERAGKKEKKLVIETSEGNLSRLQSINGQGLSPEQERREEKRIANLLRNPREQQKKHREEEEDDRMTEHLFKVLPDAVQASYGERKGESVELRFQPNPDFHPRSHEAAVFHAMQGTIWVNTAENRLEEIQGRLMRKVKFGGGLLGHLDEGGQFHVKQSEVAPGHWEVTLMQVNMQGKALFFKTIGVQQNDESSHFQRVGDHLTLAQAAEQLRSASGNREKNGGTDGDASE